MVRIKRSKVRLTLDMATKNIEDTINNKIAGDPQRYTYSSEREITKDERQLQVAQNILNILKTGSAWGYLKAATGFGKSHMIKDHTIAFNPKNVLVVTHSNVGVQQKFEDFTKGEYVFDVGVINKDKHEYGRHVTVTTYSSVVVGTKNYQAAIQEAKFPALPMHVIGSSQRVMLNLKDYDCIFLDETHKATPGTQAYEILKKEVSPDTIMLGYTATTHYHPRKQVAHLLKNKIDEIPAIECALGGWTSSFKVIYAITDITLNDVELTGNKKDYNISSLQKVLNTEQGRRAALELYQYPEFMGRQCLMFCAGVQHAKDIVELFKSNGIPAEAIYGNMLTKERNEILERFKSGKISVLANADLLREEFNHEGLEVVFNLRPMRSELAVEQRAGRAFRVNKQDPLKFARIVEFIYMSELPSKTQVTFDEVVQSPYVARDKEILALMSSEQFAMPPNSIVSVEGGEKREMPIAPKIGALKKIVIDPVEITSIQRQRSELRLEAKHMPEDFTPFNEFLKATGLNKHYAFSALRKYKNDSSHFGRYITAPGIVDWCISNTLRDRIASQLAVPQDYEPIILVSKATGKSENYLIRELKKRFGENVLLYRRLEVGEDKLPYVNTVLSKALRNENA